MMHTQTEPVRQGWWPEATREDLIVSNMGLVNSIAKEYRRRARFLGLDDLIQEGTFGLMRAAELFDPSRGSNFGTFAYLWIKQAIRRALICKEHQIRVPAQTWSYSSRLNKGKTLTERQRLQVEAMLKSLKVGPLGRWERWEDASNENDPDDVENMLRALNTLRDRYREILILRYGLNGDSLTYEDLGKHFKISGARARIVCLDAINALALACGGKPEPTKLPMAKEGSR